MEPTTDAEVFIRAMQFLNEIREPTPVSEFVQLELTGVPDADELLAKVSLMMLETLIKTGAAKADNPWDQNAMIYGITDLGRAQLEDFVTRYGA